MSYMENHFDLRIDPTRLVPGARSVITLLMNLLPDPGTTGRYARRSPATPLDNDYHEVIRRKLNALLAYDPSGDRGSRRAGFRGQRAGAGKKLGRPQRPGLGGKERQPPAPPCRLFFFIATLIVDLPLDYDEPFAGDYCGTCRRCIDACPTDAILDDKVVDGSKCISYFTIELKEQLITRRNER